MFVHRPKYRSMICVCVKMGEESEIQNVKRGKE